MSGAVGVVLTIFILMGVGMLLTHIGWIGDGASSFLSKFVVKVALTATVIQNMFGKFTAESLKSMLAGLVLPFAAIAIVMCLGILIAKRLHMPQNRPRLHDYAMRVPLHQSLPHRAQPAPHLPPVLPFHQPQKAPLLPQIRQQVKMRS